MAAWRVRDNVLIVYHVSIDRYSLAYNNDSAVAIAVGQTITLTTILSEVPIRLPSLPPQRVITAGALGLEKIASTPYILSQLRDIWDLAITRAMILSLAAICAAVPFSLGMEWLNSRKKAEEGTDR